MSHSAPVRKMLSPAGRRLIVGYIITIAFLAAAALILSGLWQE
jgi:hypothetical protein